MWFGVAKKKASSAESKSTTNERGTQREFIPLLYIAHRIAIGGHSSIRGINTLELMKAPREQRASGRNVNRDRPASVYPLTLACIPTPKGRPTPPNPLSQPLIHPRGRELVYTPPYHPYPHRNTAKPATTPRAYIQFDFDAPTFILQKSGRR